MDPLTCRRSFGRVAELGSFSSSSRAILDALARTDGHQGKASQLLGIGQKTLYNKMKEFGIQKAVGG